MVVVQLHRSTASGAGTSGNVDQVTQGARNFTRYYSISLCIDETNESCQSSCTNDHLQQERQENSSINVIIIDML